MRSIFAHLRKNSLKKNDSLVGLHHLMPLYEAISGENPVLLSYRSFQNPKASSFVFSGYVLKEFATAGSSSGAGRDSLRW